MTETPAGTAPGTAADTGSDTGPDRASGSRARPGLVLATAGFCAAAAVVAAVFAPGARRDEPPVLPGAAVERDHAPA
ncbi:hypothetical protein E2C11_17890 [Streptomyces lavendulae]|nr:hypothetical protein [Streptomyces lavendulae]TXJ77350.1 hypothetical protein E2C11_17890 [Streptomyces lavendulae]